MKGDADYDYYSWVTSIGYSEMSARRIILFYRTRKNAENFIREVKNGLDMQKNDASVGGFGMDLKKVEKRPLVPKKTGTIGFGSFRAAIFPIWD